MRHLFSIGLGTLLLGGAYAISARQKEDSVCYLVRFPEKSPTRQMAAISVPPQPGTKDDPTECSTIDEVVDEILARAPLPARDASRLPSYLELRRADIHRLKSIVESALKDELDDAAYLDIYDYLTSIGLAMRDPYRLLGALERHQRYVAEFLDLNGVCVEEVFRVLWDTQKKRLEGLAYDKRQQEESTIQDVWGIWGASVSFGDWMSAVEEEGCYVGYLTLVLDAEEELRDRTFKRNDIAEQWDGYAQSFNIGSAASQAAGVEQRNMATFVTGFRAVKGIPWFWEVIDDRDTVFLDRLKSSVPMRIEMGYISSGLQLRIEIDYDEIEADGPDQQDVLIELLQKDWKNVSTVYKWNDYDNVRAQYNRAKRAIGEAYDSLYEIMLAALLRSADLQDALIGWYVDKKERVLDLVRPDLEGGKDLSVDLMLLELQNEKDLSAEHLEEVEGLDITSAEELYEFWLGLEVDEWAELLVEEGIIYFKSQLEKWLDEES